MTLRHWWPWDGALWAEDTCARGGDLVDRGGPLAGRDKVQHGVGFAGWWLLLALLPTGLPWFVVRLGLWLKAAIGVEVLEGWRLARWWAMTDPWRRRGWIWSWRSWAWANNQTTIVGEDIPPRPPAFADRPSWRDLVADVAGLVVAGVYVWLLRGTP